MTILRRIYLLLGTPPTPFRFDPRLDRLVEDLCRGHGTGEWVLNLGSGTTSYGTHTLNLAIAPHQGVQLRADGQQLPFRDGSLSGALLRGVLEHFRPPDQVMREVDRVLRPRSLLYVDIPFLQPSHPSPGLTFLRGFDCVKSRIRIGPASALSWVLREFLAALLSCGSPWYRKMQAMAGWTTFWIRYLDLLVVPAPQVAHAASAVYCVGRKPWRRERD